MSAREPAVAVRRPLHGGAHAVAITEEEVVAHAQFVAVIQHRRSGHRQQQAVHELDLAAVALHQGRQAAADAQVDAHSSLGRIDFPEVIALVVGDHFQGQLVVVAQEHRPLAAVRDPRGLPQDVGHRVAILHGKRHVHARHQREVERHVAFVARAEILGGILGPLVGFRQQHPVGVMRVHLGADLLQHLVGFGQVLVVGAFALDQVRHRVQPQAVDAGFQPEMQHAQDGFQHAGIVEIEIGLVVIEAVPVVLFRDRVPGPVGRLAVHENDARVPVAVVRVAPDVEVAPCAAFLGRAGALEPGVLVRGVIDDQFRDDAQPAPVTLAHQPAEIAHGAVGLVYRPVIRDVVAVVAQRRRIERQQPDGGHAQRFHVVELLHQAFYIADAVVVRVEERLDVQLVDDGVLVPVRDRAIDHWASLYLLVTCALDRAHRDGGGRRRQILTGESAGSMRMCCTLPCQLKRRPSSRLSTSTLASSGKPNSHSGTSKWASCAWR